MRGIYIEEEYKIRVEKGYKKRIEKEITISNYNTEIPLLSPY
jgi:hypothetical protein